MISRATAVLALAGSAAAFAPMGTPALRKPVRLEALPPLFAPANVLLFGACAAARVAMGRTACAVGRGPMGRSTHGRLGLHRDGAAPAVNERGGGQLVGPRCPERLDAAPPWVAAPLFATGMGTPDAGAASMRDGYRALRVH